MNKLEGTMTKEVYVQVLEDDLVKTVEYYGLEEDKITFQHNNAPSHKASLTRNWLSNRGIEVLEWPSYSPDLNPIENLWSHLKWELGSYDHPPGGVLELREQIQEKWEEFELKVCQDLIESMPRRMAAVIKAKGQVTKY